MIIGGVLTVSWHSGELNINVDNFFPCTLQTFKKLLKVIELDWKHRDEILEQLKSLFRTKRIECDKNRILFAHDYSHNRQWAIDEKRKIETGKHPVGLPLTSDEMNLAKVNLKTFICDRNNALKAFKKCEMDRKCFARLLAVLADRGG